MYSQYLVTDLMTFSESDLENLAAVVKHMAVSGLGTDQCLKNDCLPLPVHFYSPVPDIADLDRRNVWSKKSELRGIDMTPERQLSFLREASGLYASETRWPEKGDNPLAFYSVNTSFGYECASGLHYMIRMFKPRSIIEIGSGNSSKVISAALRMNQDESGAGCNYTIIDPHVSDDIRRLPSVTSTRQQKVEELESSFFHSLSANDILFIDSSHTVRTGGDVNFLILEVLPLLAPGVIVHFHDIALPAEYDRQYFVNPQFRVFWTEAYLLQAFLAFNSAYEVLLAMVYLKLRFPKEFEAGFPHPVPGSLPSGSFWIRRRFN